MPKVAELKEIDGHIWARLDVDMNGATSVYLFDDADKRSLVGQETARCLGIIGAARLGEIDSDLRAIKAWIESGDWYLGKD